MAESQQHGFLFQEQIYEKLKIDKNELFYTDKWDIPNISIKSFNFSNKTIEFGSIERIFKIEEDFLLILIGYEQKVKSKKVIYSETILMKKDIMKKIKGELSLIDIEYLNEKLKEFKLGEHFKAREWAKEQKKIYNEKTVFDIRFKIDSKNQRRIQCALTLKKLFEALNKELVLTNKLDIKDIYSEKRIRNKSLTL